MQDAEKVRQRKKTVIWFIWSVSFVWLNQTNQRDQINQRDQTRLARPASLAYLARLPLTEPGPPAILATVTLFAMFTNKERVVCI